MPGELLNGGEVVVDGAATVGGELALGRNILVACMPWEGYNSEDAVLISERPIYEDISTSVLNSIPDVACLQTHR